MKRKTFLYTCLAFGGGLAAGAHAQTYPTKPITIVLASAPGGASDKLARLAADSMQKALGQPVVVVSRPGAGGSIGVESVVRSPADGYTFLLTASGNMAITPEVYKLSYDPVEQLSQVSILVDVPFVLVANKKAGLRDLKRLIDAAHQRPGQLSMGNAGLGTHQHLTQLMFAKVAGIQMRIVPYKGSMPATMDLIGGHIDTVIDNVGAQKSFIEADKVHAILTTASARMESFPNIPTARELGLSLTSVAWFGLATPKGTPADIIQRVQSAVSATFAEPEVRQKLLAEGFVPLASTPAFAQERVQRDAVQLRKAAKDFNLQLQ